MRRVVLLALAVAAIGAASAAAKVGVGVGRETLTASGSAVPGHSYRLRPDFYVVNTGDEATSYSFRVDRLSQLTGTTLPSAWVSFAPRSRRLRPGEHTIVTVVVRVPRDAPAGTYVSDAIAGGVAVRTGGSVGVGAAAATPIELRVAGHRSAFLAAIGWPWPLWGDLAAGAVALLLLSLAGWRRLGLRVVVERPARPGASG